MVLPSTSPLIAAASLLSLMLLTCPISIDAFSSPSSTSNLFRPKQQHRLSSSVQLISPNHNSNNNIKSNRLRGFKRTASSRSRSIFQSIIASTQRRTRQFNLSATSNDEPSSSSSSDGFTTATTTTTANGQDDITKLKAENRLLQERLRLLQIQNDELLKQQQEGGGTTTNTIEQRLILEDFEGWPTDNVVVPMTTITDATNNNNNNEEEDEDDELGLLSKGIDQDELCEYDDQSNKWSTKTMGDCPIEPNITFLDAMKSRAYWLVGLLALQSCSGFILSRNELLLQDHPVIVYFLTMLVGAGGNAGNQASVRVIRGLALGTLNPSTQSQFLSRELRMAFALSSILSIAGFTRAILFQTPFPETMAVTLALSMIVFSSICLGAVLPLVLQKMGVDPAHSSTTIQVIMDILGVVLTVFVSTAVLDSVWGKMVVKALGQFGL